MFYWRFVNALLLCRIIAANKYNFSYGDLEGCKEYDTKSGYGYHDYFSIEHIKSSRSENEIININLFVLAAKDAHILLSPTNKLGKVEAVYEIVLGAGGNTFAEIRRQRQIKPLRTILVKNLLSPINPLPLTIKITKEGLIDVRITGQSVSIMNATDKNPLSIKFISFSSWGTTEGKWFFDCDNENGDQLKETTSNRTAAERLELDLFSSYDRTLIPDGVGRIGFNVQLISVNFDEHSSVLSTRGKFYANWTDPKLAWNSSLYDNIKSIKRESVSGSVWVPPIKLLNGKGNDFKTLSLKYSLTINSSGQIYAETRETAFSTWCYGQISNWPRDTIACNILLGFDEFTKLSFKNQTQFLNEFRTFPEFMEREWSIISANASIQLASKNNFIYLENDDVLSEANSTLVIQLSLERNSLFYSRLFLAPLFAAYALLLLSLWTDRHLRVTLISISLFILFANHLLFSHYGAHTYVPNIVIYYNCTLVIACLVLTIFITNCWIKERTSTVRLLSEMQKVGWLRAILGMDASISYNYKDISGAPNDDIRKLIDRLAFLILTLIFIIFIVCGS